MLRGSLLALALVGPIHIRCSLHRATASLSFWRPCGKALEASRLTQANALGDSIMSCLEHQLDFGASLLANRILNELQIASILWAGSKLLKFFNVLLRFSSRYRKGV